MSQIGQPTAQQTALVKVVEAQRDVIAKMLHPALASQKDRLVEFALAATRNPAIAACTPESIVEALYTSAKVGLMPDGVEGAIVPRKERGVPKAKFEPMYQGLVKAYLRGGRVKRVHADAILEGETYEVISGTSPDIKHWPDITKDRSSWERLIATYAVAFFDDGTKVFIIIPKAELERLRANAPEGGPWSNHPVAMAWKTPLKRLRKLVPLEPELQSMLQTQEAEEGAIDIPGEVVPPKNLGELLGVDQNPPPPEVWYYEVRIDEKILRWDEWKAQPTGSKQPLLQPLTWDQLSQVDTKHPVVPVMEGMLKEAAQRQADKGAVGEPFQRAAVAWNERHKRLLSEELKKESEGAW